MTTTSSRIMPSITILIDHEHPGWRALTSGPSLDLHGFHIDGFPLGDPSATSSNDGTALRVTCESGAFTCMGIYAPAPGLEQEIQNTRCPNESLQSLHAHTGHLVCLLDDDFGSEGIADTLALFDFARALEAHGALGVIHTSAQQCLTLDMLTKMLNAFEAGADPDQVLPALVNIIPLFTTSCTYYVTRGAREIGCRNLCFRDNGKQLQHQDANDLLINLLHYLRSGAIIAVGETMDYGQMRLQAEPITAYAEHICADPDDDVLQLSTASAEVEIQPDSNPGFLAPVCAFLLVSGMDGSIDKKEIRAAYDYLQQHSAHSKLGPLVENALTSFAPLTERLLGQQVQTIMGFLRADVMNVRQKHGDALAHDYRKLINGLAKQVANASGGFFGLGSKISASERKAMAIIAELMRF